MIFDVTIVIDLSYISPPGTGEPGRLPSMGSHRVGHDWSDLAAAAGLVRKQGGLRGKRGPESLLYFLEKEWERQVKKSLGFAS